MRMWSFSPTMRRAAPAGTSRGPAGAARIRRATPKAGHCRPTRGPARARGGAAGCLRRPQSTRSTSTCIAARVRISTVANTARLSRARTPPPLAQRTWGDQSARPLRASRAELRSASRTHKARTHAPTRVLPRAGERSAATAGPGFPPIVRRDCGPWYPAHCPPRVSPRAGERSAATAGPGIPLRALVRAEAWYPAPCPPRLPTAGG